MIDIDYPNSSRILEGIDISLSEELRLAIRQFFSIEHLYSSAIREVATKLQILNDEFKYTKDRNPIHLIRTRVKTPQSIFQKLKRMGCVISSESAMDNLNDIAGIRVICPYIKDIYQIADLLSSQDDITLLRTRDYIKEPKPNGYRSLHMIVKVPVFLSDRTVLVKVEVQIRTIAMDFWASLEHDLAYKITEGKTNDLVQELKACADVIAGTDLRMQNLQNVIRK